MTHTLRSDDIWTAIEHASFAVLAHTSASGQPRSSGVVYAVVDRHLYVAVAPDSWKARQIALNGKVSLTVPVRRGGALALLLPIPPATISFHGNAIVHPAGSPDIAPILEELGSLVPAERRASAAIVEIAPEGAFVTYGIGVSLNAMRDPAVARARVPVA